MSLLAGCSHILHVTTVHFLVHQRVYVFIDETILAIDSFKLFLRLPIVRQGPLTFQIARAYLLLAELFEHALIVDCFLFCIKNPVFELQVLFVLPHRFSLILFMLRPRWSKSLIALKEKQICFRWSAISS